MPAGKNLYILSTYKAGGSTTILEVNGLRHSEMTSTDFSLISAESPLIIKAGDLLSGNDLGYGATPTHINAFGFLIDDLIDPVYVDLLSSSYTVPAGKNLYILSTYKAGGSTTILEVNGLRHSEMTSTDFSLISAESPLIIKAGDLLSGNDLGYGATPTHINAFGYLADENYFAGCGGGGSSSSAQFNNQISNYNNILGESITSGILNYLSASYPADNSFSYTVPAGKIMKTTDASLLNVGDNNPTYINGVLWKIGANLPTLLSEGTQIEIVFHDGNAVSGNVGDAVYIQYDLIDNTEGIILAYFSASYPADNSFSYTVPAGKIMKTTDASLLNVGDNNPTYINGVLWKIGANLPTLLSEGTQIEIVFHDGSAVSGNVGDAVYIQHILFDN